MCFLHVLDYYSKTCLREVTWILGFGIKSKNAINLFLYIPHRAKKVVKTNNHPCNLININKNRMIHNNSGLFSCFLMTNDHIWRNTGHKQSGTGWGTWHTVHLTDPELQNVKSFTRTNIVKPDFTSHLHHIYITFTSHLHHIYITFTWHLHQICITFTSHYI